MKVMAGSLTDKQREIIFTANRTAKNVAIVAREVYLDDPRTGYLGYAGPGEYVGIPQTWDYRTLTLGPRTMSFGTVVRWTDILAVWPLDDAPPPERVREMFPILSAQGDNE